MKIERKDLYQHLNANRDYVCPACGKVIKAGTNYWGETSYPYGIKLHIECYDKAIEANATK